MSEREPVSESYASTPSHVYDDPGDLGRRIAARRRELGLSVEDLARRAGMHPVYLDYLEHHSDAILGASSCARLSSALETSGAWLKGGGVDLPPGHGEPPKAVAQLVELDRAQSLRLIQSGGVGRAVFVGDRGAIALPVNFGLIGDDIIVRTGEGVIAEAVRRGEALSIEVDHLDEPLGEGWSVLVSGEAEVVSDPEVKARAAGLDLKPWAGGDRELLVRLTASEVTGRRIRRVRGGATPTRMPAGAPHRSRLADASGSHEPSVAELQAALELHVDGRGAVMAGNAHRLARQTGWSGRLVEVLGLLAESDERMGYLAGGRRPDEVVTWVSAWADSTLTLEQMRLVMDCGGWDPEPFVVLVQAGLLEAFLQSSDGSPRRVGGEMAGAWASDELVLADSDEVLRRVRQVLDGEATSQSQADAMPQ